MTQNSDQFVSREEYDNLKRQVAESLEIIRSILEDKVAVNKEDYVYVPVMENLRVLIGDIEEK